MKYKRQLTKSIVVFTILISGSQAFAMEVDSNTTKVIQTKSQVHMKSLIQGETDTFTDRKKDKKIKTKSEKRKNRQNIF